MPRVTVVVTFLVVAFVPSAGGGASATDRALAGWAVAAPTASVAA